MDTINFKDDECYKAGTEPRIIEVPPMLFVTVEGKGLPELPDAESDFQAAMPIVYGIVYSIKFWDKQHKISDDYSKFTTGPLEALWWSNDGSNLDMAKPEEWRWKVMMRLPSFVTPILFNEVVEELCLKKKTAIFKRAQLEVINEGLSVEIMHIGPYDQEAADIDKMHGYASDQSYKLIGKHHELYFSDPRRTSPDKLRSILRQPVQSI